MCGIRKFRNNATFHKDREDSRAIVKFITADAKRRIQFDMHRFSQVKFNSIWVHPAVYRAGKLVFFSSCFFAVVSSLGHYKAFAFMSKLRTLG